MLSERVLDELVRRSELSQALCQALWPELAVESKLQLLAALHAGYSPSTPDWLIDLALEDASPVVQYFALRHAYLRTHQEGDAKPARLARQVPEEEAVRHAKAHAIEHPLVKAAVAEFWPFSAKEQLLGASQLERLAKVRNSSMLSLEAVSDFLDEGVGKLDDFELASVAYEYFMRADTKRDLQRGRTDFPDGESAYFAGQELKKAWEVARKAGPAVAAALASNLPTSLGLFTLKVEDLATMPERVLELLAFDHLGRKEVGDLHRLMRENPGKFPPRAVKALEQASEHVRDDESEVQRERWLDSPLNQRATLEAVLALQQQVQELAEQVRDLRENPPKRGIFG